MIDFTSLFQELNQRTDEGKRFYNDVILNEEYKLAKHPDIHDSEVIIDIGACLGEFSYYIYDQAKVIYAIEANNKNYNDLEEYIEKYKLDKIKPFHLAIAGTNNIRELRSNIGLGGYSIVNGTNLVEKIEGKTINTFAIENNIENIDILKIDVESAEGEIFNAPDFKDVAPKIKFIIGEVHGGSLSETLVKYEYSYQQNGPDFAAIRL